MEKLLILFITCLFYGCTESYNSKQQVYEEIDTSMVDIQLRKILYEYATEHPQYKNNVLYTDLLETWNYKTQNSYFSIEPLLYNDFTHTNSRERGCPLYCISLGEYRFFVLSRMDNLFIDSITRYCIEKLAIKNQIYLRGKEGWYIERTNKKNYKIIAKHCAGFHFSTVPVQQMTTKYSANNQN